jgi:hypothetical protein
MKALWGQSCAVVGVFVVCIGQPAWADCMMFDNFALPMGSDDVDMMMKDHGLTLILNADGRAPSTISFTSTPVLDDSGMTEVVTLQNGLTLHYAAEVMQAEGSGGATTHLVGWLNTLPPLSVTCTAQAEVPDAAWCMPILGDLRPKSEGCGTGSD